MTTPATKDALETLEVISHLNLHGRVADSQKKCIETIRQALARQDASTVTADEAEDITQEDMAALAEFRRLYPSWWYKIGICDVSKDFDCAPQARSPEIEYIESGEWPDDAFMYDSRISLADAIRQVMAQIAERAGK